MYAALNPFCAPQCAELALFFSIKPITFPIFLSLKEVFLGIFTCIDRKCFMLIHMITFKIRDYHGKMPNLWKRS